LIRIIVVCDYKIYVFNFDDLQNIDMADTHENSKGIFLSFSYSSLFKIKGIIAVSSDPKITVIAYPDKNRGHVRVRNYDKRISNLINAHESEIVNVALNSDGSLLATASHQVHFWILKREH